MSRKFFSFSTIPSEKGEQADLIYKDQPSNFILSFKKFGCSFLAPFFRFFYSYHFRQKMLPNLPILLRQSNKPKVKAFVRSFCLKQKKTYVMFQEYGRKILCYLLSNQLYLFYVHLHRKNLVINLLYFLGHQTFALRYVDREKLVNISLESSCRFMEGAVAFPPQVFDTLPTQRVLPLYWFETSIFGWLEKFLEKFLLLS